MNPGYVSPSKTFAYYGTQRRNGGGGDGDGDSGSMKRISNTYDTLDYWGGQYSQIEAGYIDATASIKRDDDYLKPVDAGFGGGSVRDDDDGGRVGLIDGNKESAYYLHN